MTFESNEEYDRWVERKQEKEITEDHVPISKEVAERWLKYS